MEIVSSKVAWLSVKVKDFLETILIFFWSKVSRSGSIFKVIYYFFSISNYIEQFIFR